MNLKCTGAVVALCLSVVAPANAAVVFNITEQGDDVVFAYDGTLNLSGMTNVDYNSSSSYNRAVGNTYYQYVYGMHNWDYSYASDASLSGQIYSGYSYAYNGIKDGDSFGVYGNSTYAYVYYDQDYTSGDAISGSLTFENQTLASLNLIDGATSVLSWSSDNVTFNVGSAVENISAVPLPASLPMVLAGLGALGLLRRRKTS